jgi:propanediol dehydratase small subunit
MQVWNIKQLYEAMQCDLLLCNNDFERSTVKAVCGKHIRETAINFAKTRKLTPIELAIAEEFGYR